MAPVRVLVVDDERQIRRFLQTGLGGRGYDVVVAVDGVEALDKIATGQPDLVILDLGMPNLDGIEVLRRVREWSNVPIIVLSVRDDDRGKVAALDLGADDYLVKPFSMDELLARLRVALRHSGQRDAEEQPLLQAGELQLDRLRHIVTLSGEEIHLTPTEFDLLCVLMTHVDRVVTQRQLLLEVWGAGYEDDAQTLRIFIAQLRRKLRENTGRPRFIQTEPGVGYRLRGEQSL